MRNIVFSTFILVALLTACGPFKPKAPQSSVVSINTDTAPHTFDPRQVRELTTTTFIHNLYEGLMRSEENGITIPAMAKSINISEDQKTYTFKLRSSAWSDGQPVTSYDFKETWLSILNPDFPAPNAYQLYVIKGAQAAKESKGSISDVAIQTPDAETLIVELAQPTPYFLQLAASYFYYPVSPSMRNSSINKPERLITNGPFQLEQNSSVSNEWTLIPNPHYWDDKKVKVDKVLIVSLDTSTALNLFDRQELAWAGSPLSTIPVDAIPALKANETLQVNPAAGVYFLRINVEKAPLDNPKIRHALASAINRTDLVEHILQGNQQPAMRYVPPTYLEGIPTFQDNDQDEARLQLTEALKELDTSEKELPPLTIIYSSGNERASKIAQVLQQQWKKVLNIDVQIQSLENKIYFDRLKSQDYQISIGSWFADIADPISFLEVFKQKNNGTNNTQWENPQFIEMLDASSQATNDETRKEYLQQAERILMIEMPIIPLFFSSYNYLKDPKLQGVYFSELGYLDFKNAYFDFDKAD